MSAIKMYYGARAGALKPASIVSREMSITVEQFAHNLPGIARGMLTAVGADRGQHRLTGPDGAVGIVCTQKPDRYLGSLAIPVLEVRFDFSEYDQSQVAAFMQQFDRAYLKMGA
ncbi:MAG: hypothetical protein PVI79_00120 [Gammaproteobacteria bacterium]